MAVKPFYPSSRQSSVALYMNFLRQGIHKAQSFQLEQVLKDFEWDDARLDADRHLLRLARDLEQVAFGPSQASSTAIAMLECVARDRPDFFYPERSPPQLLRHPLGAEDPDDAGTFPSPYVRAHPTSSPAASVAAGRRPSALPTASGVRPTSTTPATAKGARPLP